MLTEFGGYFVQNSNSASLDAVYDSIGRLIHAEKPHDEIALVDSATTAWNRILYSLPLEKGDIILVSLIEYAANYVALLQLQKRFGIEIEVIPSDKTGRASVQAFEEMMYRLGEKVRAVSITWIPTNGGVVAPAEAIGKVCAAAKSTRKSDKPLFYLVDACQAAGHIPIDVNKLHCDALSATGRKYLRGPRGTGFLYVRHESLNAFQEPITIDHHAAPWIAKQEYTLLPSAKRFEQWERNIVGVLGLGLAVDYYLGRVGVDWAHQRINALAAKLRIKLEQLDPVSVMDLGAADSQCGIVTFTISGVEAKKIKALLQAANIYVTVSSPSSTLLDAIDRSLDDVVRASLHYFNTEEEIDEFCKQVQLIATKT